MNKMVYLLNICISGIKNIEKEIRVDFYGKNVNKNFHPEKNNVKGIYGENGTGKTAIISAVQIIKEFLFDSNYLRDTRNQLLLRELINKNTRELVFKCEFVTKIELFLIYEYEIKFLFDENDEVYVSYESLKYKKNNSKNMQTSLFVCENGRFLHLDVDDSVHEKVVENTRNLLKYQSALYMIFRILSKENPSSNTIFYVYPVIFFIFIFAYFDREDKHTDYLKTNLISELRKSLSPDEIIDSFINEIATNERRIPIKEYSDYEKSIKQLERFIRLFKPDLVRIEIDKTEVKDYYECELLMVYASYKINREFESTGIKKLIELFNAFVKASYGGIVFIDELDSNINDVYLCKIIEYFKFYGKGQLCFTSHNVDPMSVLKDNNKSIDFLTRDNRIVSWVKNGHYTPENSFRNGMIDGIPYNIDASDFISIFERSE